VVVDLGDLAATLAMLAVVLPKLLFSLAVASLSNSQLLRPSGTTPVLLVESLKDGLVASVAVPCELSPSVVVAVVLASLGVLGLSLVVVHLEILLHPVVVLSRLLHLHLDTQVLSE